MQLDLFGATEDSAIREAAPPVMSAGAWMQPEALAFDVALQRGALKDAIAILNRLKVNAASRVLMASGFAIGSSDNRADLITSVQSDIVAAARMRITGHELRILREGSALNIANDNHSSILETEEGPNYVGRTLQSAVLPERRGVQNRGDGVDSRIGGQPLDAGVAGADNESNSSWNVSELPGSSGGSREGRSVRSDGYEPSVTAGNIEIARGEGITAGDVVIAEQAPVADYVLTDDDRIGLGGLAEKFQDNLRAIRIVKTLESERRDATLDERRELVRYVGWGGLKGVFDPDNKQWARQHVALRALLSSAEWAAASRSQLDAFYTPPVVVKSMYAAISWMGFQHGRFLEPSVGVGNFFGLMPEEMRQGSTLHGVEQDILTSQIVAALYPSAKIAQAIGFQSYQVPAGYYDVVAGNPPFGSQAITDDRGSVYSGWSIHNYFFAKSIDMLRPGGIMPMVVSHSFLDKLDPHVRQWISRRAELVSGVRLPNTAFKANANTEVVTDILIFRRLDDSLMLGKQDLSDWLNTSEIMIENPKTGYVEAIAVNDYFINNPGQVLGTQSAVSSQFRANEYTVEANGNLETQLAAWVETLPQGIYVPLERSAATMAFSAVVPEGIKEGSFYIQEGIVFRRLSDAFGEQRAVAWETPNQRAAERMVGMIWIRNELRSQMWLERSVGADDETIEAGRAELNRVYGAFQKKFGFLNDPINRRLFLDDTESSLIQALEFDYEKAITPAKAEEFGIAERPARAVKADILSRRVLFPPVEVANVETAKDALLHSLNMTGRVDMGYMQRAYGRDEAAIVEELGDVLFLDPVTGLVTADAYLSGDVKTKLATAIKSAQGDSSFSRNVLALEGVIPKDKLPSEIFASIGGAWIPVDIYSAFAKEISGADVTYSYVSAAAQWLASNHGGADYAKNNNEYGTSKMAAVDILFHTMNSKGLEVKKRVLVDGQERYVTDEEATEAVRQMGDKVRGHWDSWLWADGARADRLTEIYNFRFNRIVERHYDGAHLSFPGMSSAITLLGHQKDGVWRGLQDRVMLADQVVGAGKTFELAAMAMEMRRMGISKKPMFAVPNHLTLQWRSEFYRLYPGANVLAATPADFEKENRERFFSKMVTGNWDAIVVGHSSLKKLQVPLEAEMAIIQEQFDEMADAIEEMKRDRGDKGIIRDMEKIKGNLEAKLSKLKEKGGKKDNVVDFGDLGVDALFIDEMHEFKNLFFTTQMNRVAGLGNPAGSGKAFDLFVKVRWLQETFGESAPLITATGTPVSNSLSEMFTMQRYMQYSSLKRDGLHMFDAWAKQYGDVQTVYEVAPSGTGYRLSQRFAKFKNLSSLMGSYRSFADVITLDDLKAQEIALGKVFPVPKIAGGRPLNVVAQRSELQEKFFGVPEIVRGEAGEILFEVDLGKPVSIEAQEDGKWLLKTDNRSKSYGTQEEAAYALAVEATTPRMTIDPKSIVGQFDNLRELTRSTKGKINALSLTGLANKAGLDYRIIDASAPDFEGSKINQAVSRMFGSYGKWQADKGVQLVFCDLSVPLSAKAKMASHEKRVYVRDDKGDVTHKKGTLHSPKGYEGLPYFLVAEGKGPGRTFSMFDPVTGVVLREGFDSKHDAHGFAANFVAQDGGQERWLDMRERMRAIEVDEIDDYKNHRSLDNDGDAADFEISLQDVDGATGVAGFSVYDDIKAKLVAAGVPIHQVEFIHDHDTPQAKDALFKRVNSGDVRFLLGSTPKMGAGTNVQKRLVALHHIDAPWRPSDLEQREGRAIRRGNELYERDPDGFEVEINRYATAQTYDTRRWQLLEHKAAGVEQLRNYDGENEIEDVASEASNSADMKAAASGNPLILRETQLATEVKKLTALSRAHVDNEYVIRNRVNSNKNYAEAYGPRKVAELRALVAQRDTAVVLGSYGGQKLVDREGVVAAIEKIAVAMDALNTKKTIVYRGCEFQFEKEYENSVTMRMTDGEKHYLGHMSPSGCVTRMDNFLHGLEEEIEYVDNRITVSTKEAASMMELMGKPFARAEDLVEAIAAHGKVQRALMKANSSAAVKPEERAAFEVAVAGQKEMLRALGFGEAVREIEVGDDEGLVGGVLELVSGKAESKAPPAAVGLDGAEGLVDELGVSDIRRGGTALTEQEERAHNLSSLAEELARQLHVESRETDFEPADASVAVRHWVEGKEFSEGEMREALIAEVEKRPDFRRKAGVVASLRKGGVGDSLDGGMASPLVSDAELDFALEKARYTLRIYTKTGDLYALAGNPKASVRAHVMADLMGVDKVPQAKAGVNALRDEFYRRIGIKEDTGAAMEDAFVDWFKTGKFIVVEDVSAKNGVQLSSTIQASLSADEAGIMIKKGDRFKDGQGKEFEVWNARTGHIEAFPVIDGKMKVSRDTSQWWSTTAVARSAFPEARTDYYPLEKMRLPVIPQVPTGDMKKYILVAADSVESLRKVDVYRVLIESNRVEFKLGIANYIKENRPDLVDEVDSVLDDAKHPVASLGGLPTQEDDLAQVDVDHLKTRMVAEMPVDVPEGWVVMNAPRPLVGNETMSGDFLTGRFYAAIDPADLMAEKFVEKNRELDARLVVVVSRDMQMEMAMFGSNYLDRYMELDADRRWEQLSGQLEKLRDLSYGELKTLITNVMDAKGVVREGVFSGKVLDVAGGVVVQKINRDGEVVLHEVAKLSRIPVKDDVVNIQYRNGNGTVKGKDRVAEVGR